MRWQLLIPTYSPHFECNKNFLKSCEQYCTDKMNITFVVADDEYDNFQKHINNQNVKVVTLKSLIYTQHSIIVDDTDIINKMGKYNYQSLKKMYGCLLDYDYTIVIDSENLCLQEFNSNDLIRDIVKDKNIFYGSRATDALMKSVIEKTTNFLNYDFSEHFFQTSYWLYDRNIVDEMLCSHNIFEHFFKDSPFFEAVLYNAFIHKNNSRYGYNFICTDDIFGKEVCTELYTQGLSPEYFCSVIDREENLAKYCEWINKYKIPIARNHWTTDESSDLLKKRTNLKIGTFQV